MSDPVWPLSLPQKPLRQGFASSGQQPVRRMQMESGPDRVVRLSNQSVRGNSVAWYLSAQQLAEFWSFYEQDANAGADWVLIPLFTGNTVAHHRCRINSYPSLAPMGRDWQVSFSVETTDQLIDWSV